MTQQVPATCVLGPGKTGLTIGVTVLNVDGTTYAAFSTTGVAETSVAGTYRKAGGVVVPDAGGYLVWGVSGTAYAEATVEPSAAAAVLVTPANKIDTGAAGQITTVTTLSGHTPQTGDSYARLGAPAGASVSADIATANASLSTVLARLGAWTGSGVNTLLGAFKALLSKTASTPSDIGGTFDPATDSTEAISEAIGGAAGSGATAYSITVQDENNDPIDGVEVWITTDSAGSNVVAGTLTTDAMGLVIFMLDAGDYYVWRQASGYNFTNPVAITVS